MIIQFILYVTQYSLFVVDCADVLIREEHDDLHGNQVEAVSSHRVTNRWGLRGFEPYISARQRPPAQKSRYTTVFAVPSLQLGYATPVYCPILPPVTSTFLKMKERLKCQHFNSEDEMKTAIRRWCREKPLDFFFNCFVWLAIRWRTCMERGGDYIEKLTVHYHRGYTELSC